MLVRINDEPHDIPVGTDVHGLLALLGLTNATVAIAVNGRFVPRSHYDRTLQPDDAIELVAPMGGG